MPINRVEVNICGRRFALKSSGKTEYIRGLAHKLNQKFDETFQADKSLTLFDAAVLVAMELLDDDCQTAANLDDLRGQIKLYVEEAAEARKQAEWAKRELRAAQAEIEKLKGELVLQDLKEEIHHHEEKRTVKRS